MTNKPKRKEPKVAEAMDILSQFGLPRAQVNERTAYCLLALTDITKEKQWCDASNPLLGITPMMHFAHEHYNKTYAPNTRETFRRFSMHQMVQAGIALYNPDKPNRPTNSPKAVYQISPTALAVVKAYGGFLWAELLADFRESASTLAARYAKERQMDMVKVRVSPRKSISISPGEHSELIRAIIEELAPRFMPGAALIYIGDTGEKWGYFDSDIASSLNISPDLHGKMPDVILWQKEKNWLVLVESVTSHGPVDSKRQIELLELLDIIGSDPMMKCSANYPYNLR